MVEYSILEKNVVYDKVGAGLFLQKHFPKAYGFSANGKVIGKDPYEHLKTQCHHRLAEYINDGSIKIHDAGRHKEDIVTECMQLIIVPQELIGGKIKMITKKEVKINIGHSPDYIDSLSMRMVFTFKNKYSSRVFV